MRIVLVSALLALGASCATTTTIMSDPPGATVSYHGRELGQTPLEYESEDWLWEKRKLELSYPGFHPRTVTLRRDEINPAVAIGSGAVFFFLCWPAGVGMFLAGGLDYPDELYVKLRPLRPYPTAVPPPAIPPPARRAPTPVESAPPGGYDTGGVPY